MLYYATEVRRLTKIHILRLTHLNETPHRLFIVFDFLAVKESKKKTIRIKSEREFESDGAIFEKFHTILYTVFFGSCRDLAQKIGMASIEIEADA